MALDDFLEQERTVGKQVSGNSTFTLDPKQVRKQVGTFCKEFRLYPLLRCLQAIIRVSESDLFIRHEKGTWIVSFVWKSVPEKEAFLALIEVGATQAFDDVPNNVTQHLFFGLSAALGQDRYHMMWRTPKGGFTINEKELAREGTVTEMYCELHFSLDPGTWSKLTGRNQYKEIHRELCQRLCYAPVPIHIEREMLHPAAPKAPERPWGKKLKHTPQLAWRFMKSDDLGRVRAPKLPLDHYNVAEKGHLWHLIRPKAGVALPLSVQLGELSPSEPVTSELPSPARRRFEATITGLGDVFAPVESALYLSLEGGRSDWFYPVRDGVLCEPVRITLRRGGMVAVCGSARLRYDLSGLKVIEDERFEAKVAELRVQAKALQKSVNKSLASISTKAKHLPVGYWQAVGYNTLGPYFGLVMGKVGPRLQRLLGKPNE